MIRKLINRIREGFVMQPTSIKVAVYVDQNDKQFMRLPGKVDKLTSGYLKHQTIGCNATYITDGFWVDSRDFETTKASKIIIDPVVVDAHLPCLKSFEQFKRKLADKTFGGSFFIDEPELVNEVIQRGDADLIDLVYITLPSVSGSTPFKMPDYSKYVECNIEEYEGYFIIQMKRK